MKIGNRDISPNQQFWGAVVMLIMVFLTGIIGSCVTDWPEDGSDQPAGIPERDR